MFRNMFKRRERKASTQSASRTVFDPSKPVKHMMGTLLWIPVVGERTILNTQAGLMQTSQVIKYIIDPGIEAWIETENTVYHMDMTPHGDRMPV